MSDTIAAPQPAWQDLTESGDGRQLRGRPDWTDALFFLILSLGYGLCLDGLSRCHGHL